MRVTRRISTFAVGAVVASGLTVTAPAANAVEPKAAAAPQESSEFAPYDPAPTGDPRPPAATDHTDPAWLNAHVTPPPVATVNVAVPASGRAPAGTLPLAVGRAANGIAPGSVRVRMLDRASVSAVGGHFIGFELTRTDGGAAPATVSVSVDWSGIANAFGGDFASRLRLDRVSCAGCSTGRVTSVKDLAAHKLTADLSVAPDPDAAFALAENTATAPEPDSGLGPQVADDALVAAFVPGSTTTTYALTSGADGSSGDYKASEVSASSGWQVGLGSGSLSYSYPFDVPPAVAGEAPSLALEYSSQSVDGRTTSSNNQASHVGEGWSFEPGYIERHFHGCKDEGATTGDLCWSPNNEYFLHFGGQSGELIYNQAFDEWRLRGNDPSWRILKYTGSANGDNDGEVFVVITPDGTKHWFGAGVEPRPTGVTRPQTKSAFTVPVVAGPGEPCYNSVPALSWCQQAYRWNLDRSLDKNDNVTTYFYTQELNYYARGGNSAQPTQYVRAGHLEHVEYGKRNNAEATTAPAKATVSFMLRCAAQANCPAVSTDTTVYPDVPADQKCMSTVSCPAQLSSPTFWSEFEVKSLTTWVWNGTAYSDATRYDMTYTFPPTNDATTPSLWLQQVTRTGLAGSGSLSLPPVVFGGTALPNRVHYGAGIAEPMNKYRLWYVNTELGGRVYATYDQPHDCGTTTTPAWNTNGTDCFPARYEDEWIPFRKYLVTKLVTHDGVGSQPDQTTTYQYLDTPAWHYQDSLLAAEQSWSEYRGHANVRVYGDLGSVGGTKPTRTDYELFRGMDGDKLTDTTHKGVTLTDSFGVSFPDDHFLAGMPLEERVFSQSGSTLRSTLHRYWAHQEYDGPDGVQSHDVQYVRESLRSEWTWDTSTPSDKAERQTSTTYSPATGFPTVSYERGDMASATDDVCSVITPAELIARNPSSPTGTDWLVALTRSVETHASVCDGSAVGKTDTYYDGNASLTTPPSRGNPTKVAAYADALTPSVTTTSYDAYGRVISTRTPNAGPTGPQTTVTYAPSTGYPYTGITTTNPLGQTTKTTMQFAWGVPKTVTDENNQTTTITSDALGRTLSVARPGDAAGVPSLVFDYDVFSTAPSRVATKRLLLGTQYQLSYTFVEGLGRTIETHLGAANTGESGRRVAVTRYDAQGRTEAESQPFWAQGVAGTGIAAPSLSAIKYETRYDYDSAGRQSSATQYASGVAQWTTSTEHYGAFDRVIAPEHSPVDHYSDVLGRSTKVVERPAAGVTSTTTYGYTRLGDLSSITDDASNLTSYTYDWLRRRVTANDPDQGFSTTTYDADGNVLTTTDAKQQTLGFTYDALDRKTSTRSGGATGSPLVQWAYDTVAPNGAGRLASASRVMPNGSYTTSVGGYDARGRVTSRTTSFPAGEGVPAPVSFTYGYTYDGSDNVTSVAMPAAGGLAAETVTTTRNGAGMPTKLTGSGGYTTDYVAATTYRNDGRIATRTIGTGTPIVRSYSYDNAAGRLATIGAVRGGVTVEDLAYGYDDDGNVVSVRDGTAGVAGSPSQWECFGHDDLNRLVTAFTTNTACGTGVVAAHAFGAAPYDLAYAYDKLGNITSVTDSLPATPVVRPYAYGVAGHAHAVASVAGLAYGYDANGATVARPTGATSLVWDELHQLRSTGGVAASFVYDADGARVLRNASGTTTLYLDGMEVSFTGGTASAKRYYGNVAVRANDGTLTVLLRNNQNSATTTVDVTTGAVQHQRYTPYGAHRDPTTTLTATDKGFLDKTEDPTGLDAVGARYYDPAIARFTSADPLAVMNEPQSLAGYNYGLGNPARFSDSTGLVAVEPGGSCQGMRGNCPAPLPPPTVTKRPGKIFEDDGTPVKEIVAKSVTNAAGAAVRIAVRTSFGTGLPCMVKCNAGKSPAATMKEIATAIAMAAGPKLLNKMLQLSWKGRAPDYVVWEVSDFEAELYGLGGGFYFTYTRTGALYLAPEAGVGIQGASSQVRGGWLIQDTMPTAQQLDAFTGGSSVSAAANGPGVSAAGAVTWGMTGTDANDVALEVGVNLVGSLALSETYSWGFKTAQTRLSWSF